MRPPFEKTSMEKESVVKWYYYSRFFFLDVFVNLYKKCIWPGQNLEQGVKLCKDSQHISYMFTNKVF